MPGILNPQGPVAMGESGVIVVSIAIMLLVVVPTIIILYFFAWKYRAGNKKAKYDPDRSHGPWAEIILWMIPAVIVAALSVIAWSGAHALDPSRSLSSDSSTAKPITVQVIALRWKWLFIYPEQGIATVNELEFPVNTPVHFELTADGPISSFWIPQLGSQIYAMAAMQTQLNLLANTTGVFVGKDTEINGDGYAGMTFAAKSVSQSDFDAWIASVKQSPMVLDQTTYNALVAPSINNPPALYSSAVTGLFDNVMMMYMMPMGSSTMMGASTSSSTSTTSSIQMMPGMKMGPGQKMSPGMYL